MARLSRFVAVAVLLGGATVSLSACTGGSDPIASPSPAVSTAVAPSPSVSPSPTSLTDDQLLALIPEDARAENFVSASNFAKFFVREYQRMFDDHDSALFAYLSSDRCKFCASSMQSFSDDEAAGNTMSGGEITPAEGLATGGLQSDETWLVQFPMHVAEAKYFNADGSPRTTDAAVDYNLGVLLERVDDHWRVLGLNYEQVA